MSDIDEAMKAFMNAMQEAKQWDQFKSGNLCEMLHPIKRCPFDFEYHKVQVWQGGQCVAEASGKHRLKARVDGDLLIVTLNDPRLRELTVSEFCFGQISENGDRIMWTKDIFNESEEVYPNDPSIMSLFYKSGHIARIYLKYDEPEMMIELNGTSNCPSHDTRTGNASDTDGKYSDILAYFDRHPLGSEMPVLTLLSTLPPHDRCIILEVIRTKDSANVEVYNKLSMAYLKSGKESKAYAVLQEGLDTGALDDFTYEQLVEKIRCLSDNMRLATQKPSQSYDETVAILQGPQFAKDANGQFSEFYGLLISLCRRKQG